MKLVYHTRERVSRVRNGGIGNRVLRTNDERFNKIMSERVRSEKDLRFGGRRTRASRVYITFELA